MYESCFTKKRGLEWWRYQRPWWLHHSSMVPLTGTRFWEIVSIETRRWARKFAHLCHLRTHRLFACWSRTLYLGICLIMGKLCLGRTNTRKATAQLEWRDASIARGWTVEYMYSLLPWTHSGLENPECKLIYVRVKCYICRVVGDPQLGIDWFGSPLHLGHEDLVTALHVVISELKAWYKMASVGQVLYLE